MPVPILITGCFRSGTSALSAALDRHPAVNMFGEVGLFLPPKQLAKRLSQPQPPNDAFRRRAGVPTFNKLSSPSGSATTRTNFSALCDVFHTSRYIGDKLPLDYLHRLDTIVGQFPSMRVIICIRDGRAVLASQIRHFQKPDRPWWARAHIDPSIWVRSMDRWEQLRNRIPRDMYFEAIYEKFVADPKTQMGELLNWLQLTRTPTVLDNVLAKYRSVHLDAWKRELPEIDAVLTPRFRYHLARYGYLAGQNGPQVPPMRARRHINHRISTAGGE